MQNTHENSQFHSLSCKHMIGELEENCRLCLLDQFPPHWKHFLFCMTVRGFIVLQWPILDMAQGIVSIFSWPHVNLWVTFEHMFTRSWIVWL